MDFSSLFNGWLDRNPPQPKDEGPSDERELRRLAAERRALLRRMKPEATLDLHGLTVAQALARADLFLEEARVQGLQKVLIIHGKGIHSHDGGAVLKQAVRRHIRNHPLTGETGVPEQAMGGEGALWVIMR